MVAPTEKFNVFLCRGVHCMSAKTNVSGEPTPAERDGNSKQTREVYP